MLKKISKTFLFCLFIQNLAAQSGEISLNYQYGIAGNRLRADYNSQDKFLQGKSGNFVASNWLNDHIIGFNYKHQFIKRWKLMWNFGVEHGSFNRFNNIALSGGVIYDVVKHHVNRMEYQIGLNKRFELKTSKISFDCGFDLSYRKYTFSQGTSSAQEYQPSYPYGTVQYEYNYYYEDFGFGSSYKPKTLNLEFQFNSHFPLVKNFFLDAGARVALNYFEYQNLKYEIRKYDLSGNIIYSYSFQTAGAPILKVGNYIYLTIGCSYRFDWQKIKLFKKHEKA